MAINLSSSIAPPPTMNDDDERPLYSPTNPESSATFRFLAAVNAKFGLSLASYHDLYTWSTIHLAEFWSLVWDETLVIGDKGNHVVDPQAKPSDNPLWFSDSKINWAENMLQCRSDKVAIIQATEPIANQSTSPELRRITYSQLYTAVADLVSAFLSNGLQPGDRVASYASNCIENVIACLATTAVGGIFVSAAADFGPDGVLERFEQVLPKFIFTVDAVVYNGKVHDHLTKVSALVQGLSKMCDSTEFKVILLDTNLREDSISVPNEYIAWNEFLVQGQRSKLGRSESGEILWRRGSFNDPLWILFSSGTTGRPKPIVHRAGGMLLQAKKELVICGGLQPDDVFFYYTTTGWMMWNFLVGGLSLGCTLVLYDGSPLRDPSLLWRLVDDLGITIFGTSAKYIDQLSRKYKPREHHALTTLRHIYSTGSPLSSPLFDYVYQHIHPTVLLGSITGGTDICSLFAGMCDALPVYRGQIQCRMLGMAIESFTPRGTTTAPGDTGELVCLKPFPCMPVGFWPLPGFGTDEAVSAAKERYKQAYFAEYDGVWYHGDHICITSSLSGNGGGVVMLGRSDGVLNPGGIRFGSAEIYDVIDLYFPPNDDAPEPGIVDCLAVGQLIEGGTDERVILFVKLPDGHVLSETTLEQKIKAEIRKRRSPRHVPAKIIQVPQVPYTLNGKRVEVLIKKIINGAPLSSVNPATLSNPECLEFFADVGVALRSEVA
ncbi:acetoacetyl-CoA synthetase [Armillaria borealis]|uniref:Acetoacetyl-CoA synthetase n=1 Tax=Armillaria borealis TaxID=47425 RepID=A0AA39N188_9AGAR|nr:acetoacetyl-CoA synthetase [Armillaria borealis]